MQEVLDETVQQMQALVSKHGEHPAALCMVSAATSFCVLHAGFDCQEAVDMILAAIAVPGTRN